MSDLSFASVEGSDIKCHTVIDVAVSPFVRNLVAGSGSHKIIVPDFNISEICALLNLIYTGK